MASDQTLRVAMISMKGPRAIPDALAAMETWLDRAADAGAKFVGFPEATIGGYVMHPLTTVSLDSAPVQHVIALAKKRRLWLGFGVLEHERERDARFNTAVLTGPKGFIGAMRKINLVKSEVPLLSRGSDMPVFKVAGVRMSVTTCADASYFENFRVASLRGAEIIFAPHANSLHAFGNHAMGWRRWRLERWPTYARDNVVTILGVNTAGKIEKSRDLEPSKFCSGAMVIDHTASMVASLSGASKTERMLVCDVNLTTLRQARAKWVSEFQAPLYYREQMLKR